VHPRAAASALRFALCLIVPVAACAEGDPGGAPGQPDAAEPPGAPDAGPGTPDAAAPGTPDAEPAPDAGPRQTRFEFQDGVLPTTGYRGTTDTELDELEPSDVAGGDQVARIDGAVTIGFEDRFALVRWDLTGIASGARVRTVTLALFATDAVGGSGTYQVRALKRVWDEGKATWERAEETQLWQRAGAKGADDIANVEFTTLGPRERGSFEVTFNAAGITAVQRWLDDPATNFGLLLGQESGIDGMAIATSEAVTAANRPRLIIEID
jgi:hypothetical protein